MSPITLQFSSNEHMVSQTPGLGTRGVVVGELRRGCEMAGQDGRLLKSVLSAENFKRAKKVQRGLGMYTRFGDVACVFAFTHSIDRLLTGLN